MNFKDSHILTEKKEGLFLWEKMKVLMAYVIFDA